MLWLSWGTTFIHSSNGGNTIKARPLLLISLLLLALPVSVHADDTTNNPSAYTDLGGWMWEPHAYTSNNLRAEMGVVSGGWHAVQYYNYNFNLTGATINEVWVYVEHASGHTNDSCRIKVSRTGGGSWSDYIDVPVSQIELTFDINITDLWAWQWGDFNNTNLIIQLEADIEATGCYHPDSEVGMWEQKTSNFDMTVKNISEIKKGDILLGYDMKTGEYIPNTMLSDANVLKGEFLFYRIIAQHPMRYWDKEIYAWEKPNATGHKDVCVTSEQRLFTLEKGYIRADQIEVGMHFHGLFRKEGRLLIVPVPITEIQVFKGNTAITLDGTSDIFFSHYLMGKIVKTYYLDWLPVQVYYTPAPVPLVCFPCLFIGICFIGALVGFVLWGEHRKKR